MRRSTRRLPLSESLPGMLNVMRHTPTTTAPPSRGQPASQGGRHLLHFETFDDVVRLDVVEALEADTALETRRHFAHVVLDPAQRADPAFPDLHRIAHHAHAARARDLAL